jgi:hypothetical protein
MTQLHMTRCKSPDVPAIECPSVAFFGALGRNVLRCKSFRPAALLLLAVLAAPLSAHAASEGDEALCTGPVIKVSPPAKPYARWEPGVQVPGTVFDATGKTFHLRHSSNPDPDGACRYKGPGELTTNPYAIVNPGTNQAGKQFGTPDACFKGGRIVGEVSLTADMKLWGDQAKGYCNSAALDLKSNSSTRQVVEGMRIDRVWDGIRFNGQNCKDNPGLCRNVIRDVWVSNARDDCVENDGLGGLTISNSLFDGCFAGISSDPGGCKKCPPRHKDKDEIRLDGVLLRLQGFPYTYKGKLQDHHVGAFKIHEKYGPSLVIENSVIAFEYYHPDRLAFWKSGWRRIKSCKNNYLLWLPDAPFPANKRFPRSPSCFKLLTGAEARAKWDEVRSAWIADHPDVMRVKGDPKP